MLPESFLLLGGTERRCAFGYRAELFDIRGSQNQVVRAGFAGDIDSTLARLGNQLHAFAATDVNDVEGTAGFPRQVERATDGINLGGNGSRSQVIADGSPAPREAFPRELPGHGLALGMHRHRQPKLRRALHSLAQDPVIHAGKVVDAAIGHERLEAHDPDRKSTRLNSSHLGISYAVFCLKKKKTMKYIPLISLPQTNIADRSGPSRDT